MVSIPLPSLRPWPITAFAAAAISLSAPAGAQVSSSGSATIIEPGGVNLLQGPQAPRSAAVGEVTFLLSSEMNGELTLQLPGFVAQSSKGGGTLLLDDGRGQSVTGTTMASETLSLSFGAGAESQGAYGGRAAAPNVKLLLAQYN